MTESLIEEIDEIFKGKPFLSLEDITKLLECSEKVINNWTRRVNPKRRPLRIIVGKCLRFPKKEFLK